MGEKQQFLKHESRGEGSAPGQSRGCEIPEKESQLSEETWQPCPDRLAGTRCGLSLILLGENAPVGDLRC